MVQATDANAVSFHENRKARQVLDPNKAIESVISEFHEFCQSDVAADNDHETAVASLTMAMRARASVPVGAATDEAIAEYILKRLEDLRMNRASS
jgi:hypothetical protein